MRAKYGEPLKWLEWVLSMETDECIEWPFGLTRMGYGYVRVGTKRIGAHRYVCLRASGNPPTEKHTDAAHSCANRKCCNKRHLRHATSQENSGDAVVHGTVPRGEAHGRSKLTVSDVQKIKSGLKARVGPSSLAREFGVTPSAVCLIRAGVNWASVDAS